MSIWTGKNGYDGVKEFTQRTETELAHQDGSLFKRDTEPPEHEVTYLEDALWKAGPVGRPIKVLELGCGLGIWSKLVEKIGGTYLGVDPVLGRIQYARTYFPHATFICDSATTVRLPDTFDAVLFVTVLQHMNLKDAIAALKTASAHLEVGGKVIMLESRIVDIPEEEAEAMYADVRCPAHMIVKPIRILKESVPEFEWRQGDLDDQWTLTKVAK